MIDYDHVNYHRWQKEVWDASLGFRIPVHATPCIECEGTGLVDIAIAPWREQIADCPHCGGDGFFE